MIGTLKIYSPALTEKLMFTMISGQAKVLVLHFGNYDGSFLNFLHMIKKFRILSKVLIKKLKKCMTMRWSENFVYAVSRIFSMSWNRKK